jgi:hypothetical protein
MTMPTALPIFLIGLTIALIAVFVFRPQITQTLAGKIAAFLALFATPDTRLRFVPWHESGARLGKETGRTTPPK